MSDIVLFDYWRSSAAYRMRIALGLLKLDWQAVEVDLGTGAQKLPANIARNPQGLVPTLQVDGVMLVQTLAMIEYLDETRNAGFLPDDPVGRARVRAMAYAVAMEIHPVCNLSVATHAERASEGRITVEGWMRTFIPKGLAGLELMLEDTATGPYCHGAKVSMADICLVPQIYNAHRWGVDVAPFPRAAEIAARLEELAPVAAAHPDRHKPAEG